MKGKSSFDELVEIMARLRSPDGCPWDRQQTHATLKPYLLEEAYEALEAIDQGDGDELCKELGDVLLQVVFHAQVASEEGRFDVEDVGTSLARPASRADGRERGEAEDVADGLDGEVLGLWIEFVGLGALDAAVAEIVSAILRWL